MQEILISLINLMTLSPVIYLGGVVFTASSFTWMRNLVSEYRAKSEWPYIIIVLINGLIPTVMFATEHPFVENMNPAVFIMITPACAIFEFALLSRDKLRTYLIFLGMITLMFACLFGVGATIITAVRIPEEMVTSTLVRAASTTFSLFLLSIYLIIYNLFIKKYTDILKKIFHDKSAGLVLFLYMIINGIVLGVALGLDYSVYFSDPLANPYRSATIIGMLIRYILILSTSIMLIFAQCRLEYNRKKAEEYEQASYTDPLTKLLNRAGLVKVMDDMNTLALDKGEDCCGAFFVIDLDRFKEVNDSLGHPVGDELLIRVSRELKDIFREQDSVCRLGGDEFCVYLGGHVSKELVRAKAEKINESFRINYPKANGEIIRVSASIGVAFMPENGRDYDSIYKAADHALYAAKESGRDCYKFA